MKGKGLDNILKNLNKEIQNIKYRTQDGLLAAAFLVKARALPITPILTGNLRASAYVIGGETGKQHSLSRKMSGAMKQKMDMKYTGGGSPKLERTMAGGDPWAVIGYSANYAIFVHEIDRNYTVGHWQFLHTAIVESIGDILKIIKQRARIK